MECTPNLPLHIQRARLHPSAPGGQARVKVRSGNVQPHPIREREGESPSPRSRAPNPESHVPHPSIRNPACTSAYVALTTRFRVYSNTLKPDAFRCHTPFVYVIGLSVASFVIILCPRV